MYPGHGLPHGRHHLSYRSIPVTTLISLIGKGSRNDDGGYRLASYRFDVDFIRTVPYFGLALAEYLKPQRLILAGTAGSMWDVFLQQQAADDDTVLRLMDALAGR